MSFQRDQTILARSRTSADIIANPDGVSIKRIAWAFGCAKKDTEEERALFVVLVKKIGFECFGLEPKL